MPQIPIYNCYHPILRKKTEEINHIDDNIKQLVEDMFESMYKADGIGLAANQVGVPKSLIVIDTARSKRANDFSSPMTLINPVIEYKSDEEVEMQEGCLSIPQFYDDVTRPAIIQLKYYNLDMKELILEADDILSRVIQHEIDHLNGILFFDRLTAIRKTLAKSKLKKIQRGKIIPDYPMILPDGTLAQL